MSLPLREERTYEKSCVPLFSPPGETIPEGASDDDIVGFEKRTGLKVPPLLRSWLRTSNGPCVGSGGVYGFRPDRPFLDIEHKLQLYPAWIELGWIPIANDGCGNYYLVVMRNEFGEGEPVVFLDTLQGETEPTYVVASDTWHFLRFYVKDELDQMKRPILSTEEVLRRASESPDWPFNKEFVLREDPDIQKFSSATLPWDA